MFSEKSCTMRWFLPVSGKLLEVHTILMDDAPLFHTVEDKEGKNTKRFLGTSHLLVLALPSFSSFLNV